MTDVEHLLDQAHGRLTAISVKYPDAKPFIESFHKHVRFALNNPKEAKYEKLLKKGRQWLHEMSWKHPMFRPDFMKIVEAIDKFNEHRTPVS